ncbi:MBL fold metallo-hydrolase [Ancylothrix sp. C2]|uniref:MBL fold metallo-hydrolase n=1 Tax=Ancylothrix sp. D3o TaxID=2953691 RepID=UPI0021BA5F52|nr:MBL fold metallo-hydrolase [Ancylothrix sp. D3o]MCT7948492.1 MBL fold metallo-hydrolase [Ancylothrix sp. D3o]
MQLTYLDSNSWLIETAGQRILLDPWLIGPLVFGNLPWLFKGDRPQPRQIPANIDLILLSQGLEDHAHPPTLKELQKTIPVVGSPGAAKVTTQLGYSKVTPLLHNQSYTLANKVQITAFPGSPIGPTTVENAYLLKDLETGTSLYYEPHGYHSPTLKEFAPIDVVISPLIDLAIPFLGPVIKGSQTALDLAKMVQPQVILPTAAGGDVIFEGLLMSILRAVGSVEEFQQLLIANNLSTKVIDPKPGEAFTLELQHRAFV